MKSSIRTALIVIIIGVSSSTANDLDEENSVMDSARDIVQPKCYLAEHFQIILSYLDKMKNCYTKVNFDNFGQLLNINLANYSDAPFDDRYDLAVGDMCPVWPQNKKCLFDYIKDECNQDQVGTLKRTLVLSGEMYPIALLCDGSYRELFRAIVKEGLASCLFVQDLGFWSAVEPCNKNIKYPGYDETPDFKTFIREWASCAKPALKFCAGKHPQKAKRLSKLGDNIEKAMLQAYDKIWLEYELN